MPRSAEKISVQSILGDEAAAARIEGDRSFRILGGYDLVPEALLHPKGGFTIERACGKNPLDERTGGNSRLPGKSLKRRRSIVTVPLPLLQRNAVHITPEPAEVLAAAKAPGDGSGDARDSVLP